MDILQNSDYNSNLNGLIGERINLNEYPELSPSADSGIAQTIQSAFTPSGEWGKIERGSLYNPYYQSQYKPRYEGTFAYDDLGFDPHRDNETLYNEKMSSFDSFQRSFVGMAKLYGLGLIDSYVPASWEAPNFEDAMAIAQNSKGGVFGLLANTMTSAGYSLGLITDMVLEDLALTAVTAATLGTSAPATTAAAIAKGASTMEKLKNVWSMTKASMKQASLINKVDNISKARSVPEVVTRFGNFVNPFENSMRAAREISAAGETMSKGDKYMKGVLGAWYDIQGIKSAYNESRLEGAFAEKQMEDDYLKKYQLEYGKAPSEEEYIKFKDQAKAANFATTMMNLPTIFITNKATLSALLRPLNKVGTSVTKVMDKSVAMTTEGGIATIKKLPTKVFDRLKFYSTHPGLAAKGLASYSTANFFEGFQETAQDIISGAAQSYYSPFLNNAERGSWYDYIMQSAAGQVSKQGMETFASGFLMQMFIGPIQGAVGIAARGGVADRNSTLGAISNSIAEKGHELFTSEETHKKWLEDREKSYNEAEKDFEEKVELLNDVLKDPTIYFNSNITQAIKAKHFESFLNSDEFKNADAATQDKMIKDRYQDFLVDAVNKGYVDILIDQMKNMKNMSMEDMKAAFGETEALTYQDKLKDAIEIAEDYKNRINSIKTQLPPPFDKDDLDDAINTGNINKMFKIKLMQEGYNNAVREYLFSQQKLIDGVNAQRKIVSDLQEKFNSASENFSNVMPYDEVSTTFDVRNIQGKLLEIESILNGTNGSEGLLSLHESDMSPELKRYKSDLLEQKDKLTSIMKLVNLIGTDREDETQLKSELTAYFKYLDTRYNGKIVGENREERNNNAFYSELTNGVFDYMKKSSEKEYNNQVIQYLSEPHVWKQRIAELTDTAKLVHSQRKEEIRNSLNENKKNNVKNNLVDKLKAIGITIHPEDLKKLQDEKKMPQRMIYTDGSGNSNYIDYSDVNYQEAVKIIKKEIPDVNEIPINIHSQTLGIDKIEDRSLEELIKDYDLETQKEKKTSDILSNIVQKFAHLSTQSQGNVYYATLAHALNNSDKVDKNKIIKFVTESKSDSVPLKFDENIITINLAFFAKEYANVGNSDLEFAILKGVIGSAISLELRDANSDFTKSMKEIYQSYNEYIKKNKSNKKSAFVDAQLANVSFEEFVINVMTNENTQAALTQIRPTSMYLANETLSNYFSKFISTIKRFLAKLLTNPTRTLLDDALYVTSAYFDNKLILKKKPDAPKNNKFIIVSESMTTQDVVNLPVELLSDLFEEYKIVNNEIENNNYELSDVMGDTSNPFHNKFIDWIKQPNDAVQYIVDKYNKTKDYNNREVTNVAATKYDFSITSSLTLRTPYDIKKRLFVQQGKKWDLSNVKSNMDPIINTYVTLYALWMIKNNTNNLDALDEEAGIKELIQREYKDEIEAIINNFANIATYKGPNGRMTTMDDFIKHLVDNLGYDEQELRTIATGRNGIEDLKRLTIENITADEKKRLLKGNKNIVEQKKEQVSVKDQMINATNLDELNRIYDRYLLYCESFPEEEQLFGQSDIEEFYKGKKSQLENELKIKNVNFEADSLVLSNDIPIYIIRSIREKEGKIFILYNSFNQDGDIENELKSEEVNLFEEGLKLRPNNVEIKKITKDALQFTYDDPYSNNSEEELWAFHARQITAEENDEESISINNEGEVSEEEIEEADSLTPNNTTVETPVQLELNFDNPIDQETAEAIQNDLVNCKNGKLKAVNKKGKSNKGKTNKGKSNKGKQNKKKNN